MTTPISVHYAPLPGSGAGNHTGGDVIQINVMPRGIIIDGHYDEYATFQSIFLKAEAGNHRPDFMVVRNVLSAHYGGPGAWFYLMPDPFGESCPLVAIDNVSMQPAPMYGPDSTGTKSQPRVPTVLTSLANNVWPHDASWVGDLTQLSPSLEYSSDSVLSGEPGMNYVSPGYGSVVDALANLTTHRGAPSVSVSQIEVTA